MCRPSLEATTGKFAGQRRSGAKGICATGEFADLRQRAASGDAVFKFNLELAEAGDKLDNTTVPLPAVRKKVELGTLKVTAVAAQGQGACQGVTFTPTVLPKGVLAGNDPMLAARAAPYGISLGRRTAEAGAK